MSVYMAADSDSDRQLGDMGRRRLYMNGKHARSSAETGRADAQFIGSCQQFFFHCSDIVSVRPITDSAQQGALCQKRS